MAPLRYAAKYDPFAPHRPPPWRNPRKGRDQILPSGNTDLSQEFRREGGDCGEDAECREGVSCAVADALGVVALFAVAEADVDVVVRPSLLLKTDNEFLILFKDLRVSDSR